MKKKPDEIANGNGTDLKNKKMTRKEAIRKSGFIAVSAATMMILLSNPQKTQAQDSSPVPPPAW